jgi:AcrR family transcriptional regulator
LQHGDDPEDSPLPTRERQRLDTRNRIFDVAMKEIAEHGLASLRIEQVARRAGVTRPTIYAHFPSREDFLRELQRRTEESALGELRERIKKSKRASFLHRFTDATFDLLADSDTMLRRETFALILREPREEDWMGDTLFGFIEGELAKAQARGEVPDRPSARILTRITMTALFGFFVIENEGAPKRRRQAHQMLDLLIGEERERTT